MEKCSVNGWKTRWEKKKLLVTSNFSFFHSVFKGLVLQTRKNQGLCGKGLNLNAKKKPKRNTDITYMGNRLGSPVARSFGPTVELPELEEQFQCVRLGVFRF